MHADEIARCEVLDEITLLFTVVQELGSSLEEKSHGYLFNHALELNELLSQAQRKLELIKAECPGVIQTVEARAQPAPARYRPRAF